MTITYTNGTITTSAVEQTVFDIASDRHFASWIFTHNMQAGDTVIIKIYVLDQNTSTMRLYEDQTITGVQTDPSYFIPFVPTREYKVTIQRTAGTDRSFTWLRTEVD